VYTTYALLCFYICELAMKLYVLRCHFWKESWNVLDFTIVGVDVVLLVLGWAVSNMPSVSVLRIFRLVRLARAFRAAKSFKELNALIRSFGFALKAIFWGMLMVIMILTIWSILAVQLLHPVNMRVVELKPEVYLGCERCQRAFSSVFESNLTFFQTVVAGDSWGTVALPIITEEPWTAMLFMMVIVTVNLTMLNLILAVIVEAGAKATEEDQHEKAIDALRKIRKAEARLIEICATLDSDSSGSLNIEEFLAGYSENQEFADCLESMNVTSSDIHMIFNICDEDGSGDVNYVEFVDQLRRIRKQGEQMLLYYVTEIRHKVQQLKLKFIDRANELEAEVARQASSASSAADAAKSTPEPEASAQPGATGQLQAGLPQIITEGAANRSDADAQADSKVVVRETSTNMADVLLVRPGTSPGKGDETLVDDEVVLQPRIITAEKTSPSSSVTWGKSLPVWGQIGIGDDSFVIGRQVECDLSEATSEDKIMICSVQLENVLKISQDIAALMRDVAVQSKVHTGLLNELADGPATRVARAGSTSTCSGSVLGHGQSRSAQSPDALGEVNAQQPLPWASCPRPGVLPNRCPGTGSFSQRCMVLEQPVVPVRAV
jgi:hypothetical protein